jgi:hypothetical protein
LPTVAAMMKYIINTIGDCACGQPGVVAHH